MAVGNDLIERAFDPIAIFVRDDECGQELDVLGVLEAEGFELSLCSTLTTTRRADFGGLRF